MLKKGVLLNKTVSLALAAALCVGLSAPSMAAGGYNDFEAVTGHINLKVPQKLSVTRPEKDITTPASAYFITGTSDPSQKLTMNGEPVTTRGGLGSFGVYVQIGPGQNVFTFRQGDRSESVTITQGPSDYVPQTKTVSSMAPSYDCATFSGNTINLSCVAPSGGKVVATVGGRKVPLTQAAATARDGVPATFTGKTTAGSVSGTRDLGPVTYTLTFQGKTTSYQSAGSVFLTGEGDKLVVQIKNNAASLYKDENYSAFIETPRLGAVDYVTDMNAKSYRLASGGWIPKESVTPLAGSVPVKNKVSGTSFQVGEKGEQLVLAGTSNPMFRAYQEADKLTVKLFHTTGVDGFPVKESRVFSGARVSAEDGATTIVFTLSGERALWGYDIRYDDGVTTIYAKYAPARGPASQPLAGVTVAVDAGHGGADPGAIGIPGTGGAMEKDITLATALALEKRLESLGATVVQLRPKDMDLSMNDRMSLTQEVYADYFISLHCNSIGYDRNSNAASGTEVYYYEDISAKFAAALAQNVSSYTGRKNRGAALSNYRVTLNSYAPSVLVEMGFLTNPVEYDSMASREGIFQTVNAIADGLLGALGAGLRA